MSRLTRVLAAALWVGVGAIPAAAQVDGTVSFLLDVLPDPDPVPGSQATTEGRVRVFAERRDEFGEHVRIVLSGHVDGLVGRWRSGQPAQRGAIVRPLDLYAEFSWPKVEVRVGSSRIVWGRLDEFQPTDVVNPLDLSKFLLEGRSEARLPVGVVRGRFFLPASTNLEVLAVPAFRSGHFDQLDESTSPFNLGPTQRAVVERREPSSGPESLQGGVRLTSTAHRVDWGATAYRGFRAFPTITARLSPPRASPSDLPVGPPALLETFPRFTMVGGDFETVRGAWGLRGEVAFFVDDELQSTTLVRGVPGSSVEGGVGLDRRAGNYRLAGNVLVARRAVDVRAASALPQVEKELTDTTVTVVVAADRSFARETRTLRLFAVHNPTDGTTFARAIAAVNIRDNLWLEGSGGLFTGSSTGTIGRLTNRDFLYAKLKVYF